MNLITISGLILILTLTGHLRYILKFINLNYLGAQYKLYILHAL